MSVNLIASDQAREAGVRPLRRGVVLAERQAAREEAGRVLLQARREAAALLEAARAQADEVRRGAQREGHKAGLAQVAREVARAVHWRCVALQNHQEDLATLAVEMARRVLRQELSTNPQRVLDLCRGVLRETLPGRQITLEVNPQDAGWVRELGESLSGAVLGIRESAQVPCGGCIVHGEYGRIDARLEVQLEELRTVIGGDARSADA